MSPRQLKSAKQTSSYSIRRTPLGNQGKEQDCDPVTPYGEIPTKKIHGVNHGSFDVMYSPVKVRYNRIKEKKVLRPRTSGPVGPELDFSIRTSNLPKGIVQSWFDTAGYLPITGWISRLNNGVASDRRGLVTVSDRDFAEFRPKAGCYRTREMTDENVRDWTIWAARVGVQFKGNEDYSFPKAPRTWGAQERWLPANSLIIPNSQFRKEVRQQCGLADYVTTHSHSREGKLRRLNSRKRIQHANRAKRFIIYMDEHIFESSKSLSRAFKLAIDVSHDTLKYQAFKNKMPNTTILRLFHGNIIIPDIVRDALVRIYSKRLIYSPRQREFVKELSPRDIPYFDEDDYEPPISHGTTMSGRSLIPAGYSGPHIHKRTEADGIEFHQVRNVARHSRVKYIILKTNILPC